MKRRAFASIRMAARFARAAAVMVLGGFFTIPPTWSAQGGEATFSTRSLTPETALKAAQAALKKCRSDSFQVAVAVVDRSGIAQVVIRDRFAGPHTVHTATGKAWTAVSFRTGSGALAEETQAGKASSGIRNLPGVVAIAGGVLIQAGGSVLGAIGVSGAPAGGADEACALEGIRAIADDIEF